MNGRLRQLKELGVRLAVDDFGTGYSALGYLHRLPVDILKVDRSFIAGLGRPGRQDVFVGAIAALAERLGVDAVAEGIETPAQRARLLELGWRLGQGYLLGRPEPIEERDPDGRADHTPRSPAAAPATRRRASLADSRDRPGASTGAGAASAR
jgi:EAL domain-containing protein (putative c-di-GMP-specific phosphodiesterase class I)